MFKKGSSPKFGHIRLGRQISEGAHGLGLYLRNQKSEQGLRVSREIGPTNKYNDQNLSLAPPDRGELLSSNNNVRDTDRPLSS